MALITVSGFPSSGKTRFVEALRLSFEARLQDPAYAGPSLEVKRIEDDLAHLGRESYSGPATTLLLLVEQALVNGELTAA